MELIPPKPTPRGTPGLKYSEDGKKAEGWAKKESHDFRKIFQERYFVVDGSMKRIQYYDVYNNTPNFKGELLFTYNSKCQKCPAGVKSPQTNVIVISGQSTNNTTSTDDTDMFISLPSAEQADEWYDMFNKAIKGERFRFIDEEEACCAAFDSCAIA